MFARNNGSTQERNGGLVPGRDYNIVQDHGIYGITQIRESHDKNIDSVATNPVILNPPREEMQLDQLPRHTLPIQTSILKPSHIEILLFVNENSGDQWKRPALSGYLVLDGFQTRVYLNEIKKNDKHFYKGEMSNPIYKQLSH